jgi:hypothetical protein
MSEGVGVPFDGGHGKGSYGRLYYGSRFTTLRTWWLPMTRSITKPARVSARTTRVPLIAGSRAAAILQLR